MKLPSPLLFAGAAMMIAIANVIANANHWFDNHPHLPWIFYGIAVALVLLAVIAHKQEGSSKPKPLIVPVRYGKPKPKINARHDWSGLVIRNNGEPAYMVFLREVNAPDQVFPKIHFESGQKSQITKEDGDIFCELVVEKNSTESLTELYAYMMTSNRDDLLVNIIYKDGNNKWYKSVCKFERNVLNRDGGIDVCFEGQEDITVQAATSAN